MTHKHGGYTGAKAHKKSHTHGAHHAKGKHHHKGQKNTHHPKSMEHPFNNGVGHEDPHASEEFCENNKHHGMPQGLSPVGGYQPHGPGSEGGAPSMEENGETYE